MARVLVNFGERIELQLSKKEVNILLTIYGAMWMRSKEDGEIREALKSMISALREVQS